jgi:hypothetical protein
VRPVKWGIIYPPIQPLPIIPVTEDSKVSHHKWLAGNMRPAVWWGYEGLSYVWRPWYLPGRRI